MIISLALGRHAVKITNVMFEWITTVISSTEKHHDRYFISVFISMPRPKGSTSNARERLIEAAGRGFRTGGFGGIGVDGLAKEAGLTSGAFYTHFGSKTDAFRVALHEGFEFFQRGIAAIREKAGKNWLTALVSFYFKERMEVDLCDACVLPKPHRRRHAFGR